MCWRAAWSGMTRAEMRQYLEYVADQRLTMLGLPPRYNARNPFSFMELQDVQELTNFFERASRLTRWASRARSALTPHSRHCCTAG